MFSSSVCRHDVTPTITIQIGDTNNRGIVRQVVGGNTESRRGAGIEFLIDGEVVSRNGQVSRTRTGRGAYIEAYNAIANACCSGINCNPIGVTGCRPWAAVERGHTHVPSASRGAKTLSNRCNTVGARIGYEICRLVGIQRIKGSALWLEREVRLGGCYGVIATPSHFSELIKAIAVSLDADCLRAAGQIH